MLYIGFYKLTKRKPNETTTNNQSFSLYFPSKKLIFVFILLLLLPLTGCKSFVKETVVEEPVRIEIVEPKPERGFCYSDPNNSHWYLAKTADEPGWSFGDSCYTPSGSVTPYGGRSCIGGSGLTSCISACETAVINLKAK